MPDRERSAILAAFRELSACHISDGLKQVGGGGGVIHGLRPVGADSRFCGVAVTVQCTFKPHGDADRTRYGAATIPDAVGPDQVLVLDNDGHVPAVFGIVASHAVASQGGAGVVVNGGVRDVEAISEVGLPIYARHEVIFSGYGYVEREFAPSVEIDRITIHHGDYLVGARGGIVVIPQAVAGEVAAAARTIEDADQGMIERIRAGQKFKDLWAASPRGDLPFADR